MVVGISIAITSNINRGIREFLRGIFYGKSEGSHGNHPVMVETSHGQVNTNMNRFGEARNRKK